MKRFMLILFLLFGMLALAACGGGEESTASDSGNAEETNTNTTEETAVDSADTSSGPITVSVWNHAGQGEEREAIDTITANFNSSQDEYVVEIVELPDGSYTDQVNAAALAGDLPCLLDFDGPLLYNFAWSGYLSPIDAYVTQEMKDDFLPSIIAQGTYAGNLYSLGQFDSGLAIYGNKAYLEEAGVRIPTGIDDAWDLVEFEEALAALQALPQVEYALDMHFNYGRGEWYTYGFSPILQGFGGDLIDRTDYQTTAGILDGPESVAAMTALQNWVNAGYINPGQTTDDDFYGSKISALAWVGHWMYGPHKDGLGDDLVLIPMPDLGAGAATGMGSWNWGITSFCENPDGAWAFLEYMVQPENILIMTDANGAVPARFSALEQRDELFGEGGDLYVFIQQLNSPVAVPRPQTAAYATITSEFAFAVDSIVTGGDVQTALSDAAANIDLDIEDNNGYK
ncbi:MAG: sugar ABC transporter substrate-binding protein [Anaerolineales bacterium]|nr:sugar ABC transporter substrate-binding protein [Anaerolineales bacterium]MCB9004614.1 sugar ABC transporter substrate-binding protein [Ardenticatenaceae bacterium]